MSESFSLYELHQVTTRLLSLASNYLLLHNVTSYIYLKCQFGWSELFHGSHSEQRIKFPVSQTDFWQWKPICSWYFFLNKESQQHVEWNNMNRKEYAHKTKLLQCKWHMKHTHALHRTKCVWILQNISFKSCCKITAVSTIILQSH